MSSPQSGGPELDRLFRLGSFVNTLYLEIEKLSKKAPTSSISDLALDRTNRSIREAKELMGEFDEYMKGLAEFVPAGSNPESRDAVLILAEIQEGIRRVESEWEDYEV